MNRGFYLILWILAAIIMLWMVIKLAVFYYYFSRERYYLKEEIRRAGDEWERKHWKHKLCALYVSLIPGISRKRAEQIVRRKKHRK